MDKKAQIQELISLGKTEEALELLEQLTSDAVLLQSRYNGAKRQYSMGMIDFSEWSRTQAQINYAALEMMNSVKKTTSNQEQRPQGGQVAPAQPEQVRPRAFISYNEKDALAMRSVKAYLEKHDIKVFVDIQDLGVGDRIENFIEKALRDNQFIVSIISENSLKDGWVNQGLKVTNILERFGSQKWVPLSIDQSYVDPSFFNNAMDFFEEREEEISNQMKIAIDKKRDTRSLQAERTRIQDLKNEFPNTIQALGETSVADISGRFFDIGMNRAINAIIPQNSSTNAN